MEKQRGTPAISAKARELLDAGKSTYLIARVYPSGRAAKNITCLLCGATSGNPNDIARKFCGRCKTFHEDVRTAYEVLKVVQHREGTDG